MGLSCAGSLIHGLFSIVNTAVLHDAGLAESMDEELHIWRADSKYT